MATVSVVVATYRRDAVLQRALDSLVKQTYKDFEVILVDDNDNAEWNAKVAQIAENFCVKNPTIPLRCVQNHPNLGSARTRNAGIKAASGEYICFLDDDDVYCPPRIENQLMPMMEKKADYGVTDLALYTEAEKLVEVRRREYIQDTSVDALLKDHLLYHITGTDAMMFRREYLIQIGGFPLIDIGDEFYLMQKAIEAGGAFLYVPVCDIRAYIDAGDGGLSRGQGKIKGENDLYEHKKKYFTMLDRKSVRYIKMRHRIVLAYSYLREKNYLLFGWYGFLGTCCDPMGAWEILRQRWRK